MAKQALFSKETVNLLKQAGANQAVAVATAAIEAVQKGANVRAFLDALRMVNGVPCATATANAAHKAARADGATVAGVARAVEEAAAARRKAHAEKVKAKATTGAATTGAATTGAATTGAATTGAATTGADKGGAMLALLTYLGKRADFLPGAGEEELVALVSALTDTLNDARATLDARRAAVATLANMQIPA